MSETDKTIIPIAEGGSPRNWKIIHVDPDDGSRSILHPSLGPWYSAEQAIADWCQREAGFNRLWNPDELEAK